MGGGLNHGGDADTEPDNPFSSSPDVRRWTVVEGGETRKNIFWSEGEYESVNQAVPCPERSTVHQDHNLQHWMQAKMNSRNGQPTVMTLDEVEHHSDAITSPYSEHFKHSQTPASLESEGGPRFAELDHSDAMTSPYTEHFKYSQTPASLESEGGSQFAELDHSETHVQQDEGSVDGFVGQEGLPGEVREIATSRVFKLMDIRHDSLDLSLVEKVILSEKSIFALCNNLASCSAKKVDGQRSIDFPKLDALSKTVVGFYGSKHIMRDVFHRLGMASENSVWSQMLTDKLTPGLYLWLRGDSAFVFYWHQEESLPNASQRSMSCNFVRYIVDLCHTVCVCMEAENLKDNAFSGVQKFSKKQRTKRLQIALVKASDNSITVSTGFSDVPQSLSAGINAREFKWTEGSSRVALLASFPQKPKVRTLPRKDSFKLDTFPSKVKCWKDQYSLDLRKLSSDDLLVFLEAAKLSQYDDYQKIQSSHMIRKQAFTKRKYDSDKLKEAEVVKLRQHFASYVDICLELEFPVEHRQFSADSSITKKRGSDEEQFPATPSSEASLLLSADSSNTENQRSDKKLFPAMRSSGACPIPQEVTTFHLDKSRQYLMNIENEIYGTIFGKQSVLRFIFPGANVCMHELYSGTRAAAKSKTYTLQIDDKSQRKYTPLQYGNAVILKSDGESLHGKLYHLTDKKFDGLVVNDGSVGLDLSYGKSCSLEFQSLHPHGLESWIRSEAQSAVVRDLYRKASFLTTVLSLFDVESKRNYKGDTMLMLLKSNDLLQKLQPFLRVEFYQLAKALWTAKEALQIDRDVNIPDDMRTICRELYATQYSDVELNVWTMARKHCEMFLTRKISAELEQESKSLTTNARKEENEYLSKVKEDMSKSEGESTLWIESCKIFKKGGGVLKSIVGMIWNQGSSAADYEVSVSYKYQEREVGNIIWKAFELAPLQHDLEKMHSQPEYVLTPACSDGKELIDLNPASQKLLKVFFLRGGQALILIQCTQGGDNECHVYVSPKMGVNVSTMVPIISMKRGYDEIVAFDEKTRYIAFYNSSFSTIRVYRFDDNFHHMDRTGVDIHLSEYSVERLQWMDFLTGRNEIALIDEHNRLLVCDVNQPAMVRPGNVHLGSSPIVSAMISTQGSCLLVLRLVPKLAQVSKTAIDGTDDSSVDGDMKHDPEVLVQNGVLTMDVYKVDDSIEHVDSVNLQAAEETSSFQFAVVSFDTQQHCIRWTILLNT